MLILHFAVCRRSLFAIWRIGCNCDLRQLWAGGSLSTDGR